MMSCRRGVPTQKVLRRQLVRALRICVKSRYCTVAREFGQFVGTTSARDACGS